MLLIFQVDALRGRLSLRFMTQKLDFLAVIGAQNLVISKSWSKLGSFYQ